MYNKRYGGMYSRSSPNYIPRKARAEGPMKVNGVPVDDSYKFTSSDGRTSNKVETDIVSNLEENGWEVLKNGWPDLLAYKDGKIRLIEVKPAKGRYLSLRQRRMAQILKSVLGLDVEIASDPAELKEDEQFIDWDGIVPEDAIPSPQNKCLTCKRPAHYDRWRYKGNPACYHCQWRWRLIEQAKNNGWSFWGQTYRRTGWIGSVKEVEKSKLYRVLYFDTVTERWCWSKVKTQAED